MLPPNFRHAEALGQRRLWMSKIVDTQIGDDQIKRRIGERQRRAICFHQLDIRQIIDLELEPSALQRFLPHIHPNKLTRPAKHMSKLKQRKAGPTGEVQHAQIPAQFQMLKEQFSKARRPEKHLIIGRNKLRVGEVKFFA
jgi:hypothetical protein